MAKGHATLCKIYYDGYDLSSSHSRVALDMGREELLRNVFGQVGVGRQAGLHTFELAHEGYIERGAGQVEDLLFADLGTEDKVMSICQATGIVGDPAYTMQEVGLSYVPTHRIGELQGFVGAAYSRGNPVRRGFVLATGAKTETGSGDSVTLGAVSATQYLHGTLHCTAVSGTNTPTITVKIQSAPLATFLANVTDRITFTAKTAVGAQWATRVAGEITDTYWRAVWTVSGTNPSLTIHCIAAIQGD